MHRGRRRRRFRGAIAPRLARRDRFAAKPARRSSSPSPKWLEHQRASFLQQCSQEITKPPAAIVISRVRQDEILSRQHVKMRFVFPPKNVEVFAEKMKSRDLGVALLHVRSNASEMKKLCIIRSLKICIRVVKVQVMLVAL